jgi:diguanylate cyclase (GGDEF)-like protein
MGSVRIPPELERAVRIAHVPEAARMLVRQLGPCTLRVTLGGDLAFHRALPKLLKLASLEPSSLALDVTPAAGATAVTLARGDRSVEIAWESLREPLEGILETALASLVSSREALGVAREAHRELARLEALHVAAGMMLDQSTTGPRTRRTAREDPLEHALATFLSAVTAGSGLGMHRAALFLRDVQRGAFSGYLGVGPADRAEAHRTWESLEEQAVPFEKQLALASTTGAFGERVKTITLHKEPEVIAAVEQGLQHCRGVSAELRRALFAIEPGDAFVLVPLEVKGHVLGLLYADRCFSTEELSPAVLDNLARFAWHGALAWETLRLLYEVEHLARTDSLTGLLNRREFESRFTQERSRAVRSTSPLSVLVLDLDEFRAVNERAGHEGGDNTLRVVGKILLGNLRSHDVAARFGGDEFVVLLPGASPLEAALVARRIGVAAHRRGVSLSIGAASYPEDSDHPDDLFGLADKNLYDAKARGRGRASLGSGNETLIFADEEPEPG